MRRRLAVAFLGIVLCLGTIQIFVPKVTSSRSQIRASGPPIICPDSSNGASVAIGGEGIRISPIGVLPKGVKDAAFTTKQVVTTARLSTAAHLVENSLGGITQLDASSGLAGLACPREDSSYWFVGGSAALTSRDWLVLVNTGHGEATATIYGWTGAGAIPSYPVVVPAQTTIRVGLDSIAPGVNEVVIHVLVRSGRMAASLYDQRSQGLTSLGSDFVSPGIEPSRKFVVLGIPRTSSQPTTATSSSTKKKSTTAVRKQVKEVRILRLLSPGNDSSVRVDAVGAGDSFTPLGLDSIELKAGVVRDIQVTASMPSSAYAFVVTADSPVVAGVFSNVVTAKGSDIAWTSSAPRLSGSAGSTDFDGTAYFFYSHVSMVVQISSVRVGSAPINTTVSVPAEDVVSWTPAKGAGGAYAIKLKFLGGNVYVARVLRTDSGITTSPLRPINVSNQSTASMADVGVGMPR